MSNQPPTEAPSPAANPAATRHLAGRVALVTGASRGIGRAIAERLAGAGATVACLATRAENCAETVEACRAAGATAVAFGVDLADHAAVTELVGEVQAELGGLAILVNNAGLTRDGLLMRMSEDDYDRVLDVNLKGAWSFCRAAARPLLKCAGRIVNVTSVVGLIGNAGQANYAASKAGLVGLTRALAKEFAGRGVTVNAVAPGYIETDMTAALDEKAAAGLTAAIPLGRIGRPEDVAAAVEYLVGPAGAYVTGQVLVVDGGLAMGAS